jgi:hypothetical protein
LHAFLLANAGPKRRLAVRNAVNVNEMRVAAHLFLKCAPIRSVIPSWTARLTQHEPVKGTVACKSKEQRRPASVSHFRRDEG